MLRKLRDIYFRYKNFGRLQNWDSQERLKLMAGLKDRLEYEMQQTEQERNQSRNVAMNSLAGLTLDLKQRIRQADETLQEGLGLGSLNELEFAKEIEELKKGTIKLDQITKVNQEETQAAWGKLMSVTDEFDALKRKYFETDFVDKEIDKYIMEVENLVETAKAVGDTMITYDTVYDMESARIAELAPLVPLGTYFAPQLKAVSSMVRLGFKVDARLAGITRGIRIKMEKNIEEDKVTPPHISKLVDSFFSSESSVKDAMNSNKDKFIDIATEIDRLKENEQKKRDRENEKELIKIRLDEEFSADKAKDQINTIENFAAKRGLNKLLNSKELKRMKLLLEIQKVQAQMTSQQQENLNKELAPLMQEMSSKGISLTLEDHNHYFNRLINITARHSESAGIDVSSIEKMMTNIQ